MVYILKKLKIEKNYNDNPKFLFIFYIWLNFNRLK